MNPTPRCLVCGKETTAAECRYHPACAKRLFGAQTVPGLNYTQDELNALARETIQSRISVPGVQPKLSLHLERGRPGARLTLVGLAGDYILKPQSPRWASLPEAEHWCMLLAKSCRIATVDFGLIPLQSGEYAYLTRRMDRVKGRLLHMEDLCQILNKMTFQKYQGSMEQIGRALRNASDLPGLDCVRYFEVALFSFLTGNSDMHLKNFSLLRQENGRWELAPAYDLLPVNLILPEDREEMALTVNGKKSRLTRRDFEALGRSLLLTAGQIDKTIARITEAVHRSLPVSLDCSFLPDAMRATLRGLVTDRLTRLT